MKDTKTKTDIITRLDYHLHYTTAPHTSYTHTPSMAILSSPLAQSNTLQTLSPIHHTDGEIMELERVAREAVLRHMLEPAVLAGK
jgi:hypothetical protein